MRATRGYISAQQYCYRATVVKVINRSTVILDVDLGFKIFKLNQKFKILSINEHQYKSKAINAKYKVLRFIKPHDKIVITSQQIRSKVYCEIMTDILPKELYHYSSKMYKIVDGDTIDVELDLGFSTHYIERFRLYGIDAWETRGEEKPRGLEAKSRVIELLPVGSSLLTKTYKDSKGKYGRYLGDFFIDNEPRSLNRILVEEGHAIWKQY